MGGIIKREMINTSEWISQINDTTVKVSYGDIFQQKPFKVIAFNEYFDTIVDDIIISHESLNGQLIDDHVNDIELLDKEILSQIKENNFQVGVNDNRKKGNKIRCKLGSIIKYNDFLLTAFSRFNEREGAYLTRRDYNDFLFNFWSEIDRLYANRQVSIPLLGSGVTRTELNKQELLSALIDTFKISKIRLAGEGLNIVLHDTVKSKINLASLK